MVQAVSLTAPSSPLGYLSTVPHQGGQGRVSYWVAPQSDPGGRFSVNESGVVQLSRPLDRETDISHSVLVLALDHGVPDRRTATATLTVSTLPEATSL